MKKAIFLQSLNALESAFGEKASEDRAKIYWDILKGYSDIEIKKAVIGSIRRLKFFPKISEIIEMIEGNVEDEPELAWFYLKKIIEGKGYYQSVFFPEYPAIGAVIENIAGDWCNFIEMLTENEEKWIKKEFIKIYPIMKRRGNYPARLIGRFELDNSNKGYSEEYMIEIHGRLLNGTKVKGKKLLKGKSNE